MGLAAGCRIPLPHGSALATPTQFKLDEKPSLSSCKMHPFEKEPVSHPKQDPRVVFRAVMSRWLTGIQLSNGETSVAQGEYPPFHLIRLRDFTPTSCTPFALMTPSPPSCPLGVNLPFLPETVVNPYPAQVEMYCHPRGIARCMYGDYDPPVSILHSNFRPRFPPPSRFLFINSRWCARTPDP